MMIQNILNLVGKDCLIGHLITTARALGVEFSVTSSDKGQQYIASLTEHFEFGMGLRPEVGFCYANECEAENHLFENQGKWVSLLMDISQSEQPLCLFNHLGERAWTYVFVLMNPCDVITLFQKAKPCDYFLSNVQGQFILASNWHDFSFVAKKPFQAA